jgi:hypothetical protein
MRVATALAALAFLISAQQPAERKAGSLRQLEPREVSVDGSKVTVELRLLQHRLRRLLLLVRRVAVLAQDALDEHAELGANVLAQGPVDGHVGAHGLDELARDAAQGRVAEHGHGAVVRLEGVVEGELVLREAELLAARVGLAHVARELDQLLDHLRGLDRAVLVAADGLFQHLGERARLHDVLLPAHAELSVQELLQELDGEVLLRHAAHFGEELVGEDRDVGLLEPSCGEDVDDALRSDRAREDLADGVVELLLGPRIARRALGEHGLQRLEEGHVVADLQGLLVRHREREGLRQLAHSAHDSRPAVSVPARASTPSETTSTAFATKSAGTSAL